MSASSKPAEKFHPSEYIREEMEERGWSQSDFARHMGGDWQLNMVALDFYLDIGPEESGLRIGNDTAAQLGAAFGTSAELFLNLEKAWLA